MFLYKKKPYLTGHLNVEIINILKYVYKFINIYIYNYIYKWFSLKQMYKV
jgi:hypothetical protein